MAQGKMQLVEIAEKKPKVAEIRRSLHAMITLHGKSLPKAARDNGLSLNDGVNLLVEEFERIAREREAQAYRRGRLSLMPPPFGSAKRAA